jgi:hypothetical protein
MSKAAHPVLVRLCLERLRSCLELSGPSDSEPSDSEPSGSEPLEGATGTVPGAVPSLLGVSARLQLAGMARSRALP